MDGSMAIEIERRFLVSNPGAALKAASVQSHIAQGYFGVIDGLRVRVRILSGNGSSKAFLTFKGARRGICRLEFEYPLALERAQCALNRLPPSQIIKKIRHGVRDCQAFWSVDQFLGHNSGLVLAEVELIRPDQEIELPGWIGEEVTFNPRYGNSRLARSPIRHLSEAA